MATKNFSQMTTKRLTALLETASEEDKVKINEVLEKRAAALQPKADVAENEVETENAELSDEEKAAIEAAEANGGASEALIIGLGVGILLLEADGTLPKDQLENYFHELFPFIDNPETIQKLAFTTNQKFLDLVKENPSAKNTLVHFSKSEITDSVHFSELTQEQIDYIYERLK